MYVKSDIQGDGGPPLDGPHTCIKVGNAGFGPMYLQGMSLHVGDDTFYTWAEALGVDSTGTSPTGQPLPFKLSTASDGVLRQQFAHPKPFAVGQAPLAYIRSTAAQPGDARQRGFAGDFVQHLRDRHVRMKVRYTMGVRFPLSLFTVTRELNILDPEE